ncbi:hypothetical protein [Herbaspirillum huttiense]|uniref:Lipoprotein n=1 Tax=Herbaspirillum huttiense subsp. lycopersici TaxID=3074428 RepID=A0ABU2EMN6_9BURK|nr:hypothetical protein [Herbaspirillum huttiense]MDR9849422.1 hypothetical protein [Herbaspirillum huttiense SE1]
MLYLIGSKLGKGWQIFLVVSLACLISACSHPKVRNSLVIRHSSERIKTLYIDTSAARGLRVSNTWPHVEQSGFEEALAPAFSAYGVEARLLHMEDELRLRPVTPGDYLLKVSFKSGFVGTSGSGAFFALELTELTSNAPIWAGNIFVGGSSTILTENLGKIVAGNIAEAMNTDHLFSDLILASRHEPITNGNKKSPPLTPGQLEGFANFKKMISPKAFVVGGNRYFYASGQTADQDPPAVRALQRCESEQQPNCRVISDGYRVFP